MPTERVPEAAEPWTPYDIHLQQCLDERDVAGHRRMSSCRAGYLTHVAEVADVLEAARRQVVDGQGSQELWLALTAYKENHGKRN